MKMRGPLLLLDKLGVLVPLQVVLGWWAQEEFTACGGTPPTIFYKNGFGGGEPLRFNLLTPI
jgi:hypothetical protein